MSGRYPGGLYGAGMHDHVMREIEIGPRAALYEDMEACGDSALDPDPPRPETDREAEAGS